eukprot:gene425-763_t
MEKNLWQGRTTLVMITYEKDALWNDRWRRAQRGPPVIINSHMLKLKNDAIRSGINITMVRPWGHKGELSWRYWGGQQIGKIRISQRISTDYYLILDSKNVLIAPLLPTDLYDICGRGKKMENMIKLTKSRFAWHKSVTPALLHTSSVRHMVQTFLPSLNLSFDKMIWSDATEFFLYDTYITMQNLSCEAYSTSDKCEERHSNSNCNSNQITTAPTTAIASSSSSSSSSHSGVIGLDVGQTHCVHSLQHTVRTLDSPPLSVTLWRDADCNETARTAKDTLAHIRSADQKESSLSEHAMSNIPRFFSLHGGLLDYCTAQLSDNSQSNISKNVENISIFTKSSMSSLHNKSAIRGETGYFRENKYTETSGLRRDVLDIYELREVSGSCSN